MKYISHLPILFCFILASAGTAFGQNAEQEQAQAQPIFIENNGTQEQIDQAVLKELDPSDFKKDESGRSYVIIDGRKVIVDEQGVQSLRQPGSAPVRKDEPADKPE